ncbi:MAG: hypothetical protein MJ228_04875 [Bacilli bacterium]|nr:hypothetical protein [Bacilli bacterium]
MGALAIIETIFGILFMGFGTVIGVLILKNSKGEKQFIFFGVMTLIMVLGITYWFISKIILDYNLFKDNVVRLIFEHEIGTVSLALFFPMIYVFYEMRYETKNWPLRITFFGLFLAKVVLTLLPDSLWGDMSVNLRSAIVTIPNALIIGILVILFYYRKNDKSYRYMWIILTIVFSIYFTLTIFTHSYQMYSVISLFRLIMDGILIWLGFSEVKK